MRVPHLHGQGKKPPKGGPLIPPQKGRDSLPREKILIREGRDRNKKSRVCARLKWKKGVYQKKWICWERRDTNKGEGIASYLPGAEGEPTSTPTQVLQSVVTTSLHEKRPWGKPCPEGHSLG